MMSWAFLGAVPSAPLILTLIPIVLGVILASVSVRPSPSRTPLRATRSRAPQEATFNWSGFLYAIASNITFQVQTKRTAAPHADSSF